MGPLRRARARRQRARDGAHPRAFEPAALLGLALSRAARRSSARAARTRRSSSASWRRSGKRYSGDYADENQGRGLLPRVSRWSVWNEPNQGGWLTPQWVRRNGRLLPSSPGLYRGLVRAAIKALRDSGHASDEILLGETAPLGRVTGPAMTRPMAPGAFLRGILCIDGAGRSLRGPIRRGARLHGPFLQARGHGVSPPPVHARGQPAAHRAGRDQPRSRSPRSRA